jgi:MFS family permease
MTYAFVLYTAFRFHYNAEQNGYLFAFIGFLAIVMQGALFSRLATRFGEARLAVIGCLILVGSLFAVPFVGPDAGGLIGLLIGISCFSLGNSLASPALTSLASKNASESEQGKTLGFLQSAASLARAVGPTIGGVLLNNSMNEIDDSTLYRTFWTASAIMFAAFLTAVYFSAIEKKKELVL